MMEEYEKIRLENEQKKDWVLDAITMIISFAILIFLGTRDIPLPVKLTLLIVGLALIVASKYRLLK